MSIDMKTGKRITVHSQSAIVQDQSGEAIMLKGEERLQSEKKVKRSMLRLKHGQAYTVPVKETSIPDLDNMKTLYSSFPESDSAATKFLDSSGDGIVFYGYWKYLESRTNCEPDVASGGSTDAYFRCSTQNTYNGLRGARVEIWRLRNNQWTKLGTLSTNLDSSGWYTYFTSDDWRDTDQFKSKIFLERRVEEPPYTEWRWRCLSDGGLTWAETGNKTGRVSDGYLYVNFGSLAILGEESRIYASLQDSWDVFKNSLLKDDLLGLNVNHYIRDEGDCPCDSIQNLIRICRRSDEDWKWKNGNLVTHELGHVYHTHAFDNHLQFDYNWGSMSDGWHSWASSEWQETVLVEGWANWVAAASFYGPSAGDPMFFNYHMSDAPNGPGDPVCVESSDPDGGPERCEGNYARFMWDAYDSVNDDAYGDTVSMSIESIVSKMYDFPPGTSNRQRDEKGPGGVVLDDGPNAWDYYYRVRYGGGGTDYNLVNQVYSNCLENSAWN